MSAEKRQLYQLIISQLNDDGLSSVAQSLSDATMIPPPSGIQTNRLDQLVQLGNSLVENKSTDTKVMDLVGDENFGAETIGINLERENNRTTTTPNFVTGFVATHKLSCCTAKFSRDGKFICTGSEDNSIKLLDVEKMKVFNHLSKDSDKHSKSSHPVIKTYYRHNDRVNDIDFHPIQSHFCSASNDKTIQLFDIRSGKQAYRTFNETHNVNSVHFHPSGDFLLVGTDHFMIRVLDIKTSKAFTSIQPQDHHKSSINQVRYSNDGTFYVSCSWDGSIKIWDAVTNNCERVIYNAHSGRNVNSVKISKSGKYILSAGTDSTVRLWDLVAGKQLSTFAKHTTVGDRCNVDFGHNEEYIVCVDEPTSAGIVYNTRTGELDQRLAGHNNTVRWIAASPTEAALITCSDDHRARFWCTE